LKDLPPRLDCAVLLFCSSFCCCMDCHRSLLSSFFEVLVRRWSSRILERTSLPLPVLEEKRETDFLSTRRILIEVCFFFSGPGILERETETEREEEEGPAMRSKGQGNKIDLWKTSSGGDVTSVLSDEILLHVFRLLSPSSSSSSSNYSLVCKRWMRLYGLLRLSIKVQDWTFLETGRMSIRFPNLTDVDLTRASVVLPAVSNKGSSILLTHQGLTVQLRYDCVLLCSSTSAVINSLFSCPLCDGFFSLIVL
jgi:hypothetical protein